MIMCQLYAPSCTCYACTRTLCCYTPAGRLTLHLRIQVDAQACSICGDVVQLAVQGAGAGAGQVQMVLLARGRQRDRREGLEHRIGSAQYEV